MGYESLSSYGASPVFQSLVSQGRISNPVLSFYFAKSDSELYIGGTNHNHYTGSFTYMPVTTQAGIHDDAFGSGLTIRYCRVTGKARSMVFLSTGRLLSVARVPSFTVRAIYDQIPGSKDAGSGTWTSMFMAGLSR